MSLSTCPWMLSMIALSPGSRTASLTLIIVVDISCSQPVVIAFSEMLWELGSGCLDLSRWVLGPADTHSRVGAADWQWQTDRPGRWLQPEFAHGSYGSSPPAFPGKKHSCPWRPQGAGQKCHYHLFFFPGKCRALLLGLRAKTHRPREVHPRPRSLLHNPGCS